MADEPRRRVISQAEAHALLETQAPAQPKRRVISEADAAELLSRQQQAPRKSLNAQYGKRDDWLGTLGRFGIHTGNTARTLLGSMALGFGDEIEAGVRSLIPGQTYEDSLANARAGIKDFAKHNPNAAVASDIIGSVLTPIPVVGPLKNVAKGAQLSNKGRIALAGAQGLAGGAADGFGRGEGGFMDRALNAGITGGLGLLGGTAFGSLVEALGATGRLVGSGLKNTDPGTKAIARRLVNMPKRKLDEGMALARRAESDDVAMYLPELLDDPQAYKFANYLKNNEGSERVALDALDARDAELVPNLKKAFSKQISTTADAETAGRALKRASKDYMTSGRARRDAAVEKLYNKAYEESPTIDNDAVRTLLGGKGNNDLKREIRKLKEMPNFADLPDNSTKLLHNAASQLEAEAQKVGGVKGKNIREFLQPVRQALKDSSPEFAKADRRYSRFTRAIESIDEGIIGEMARAKTADEAKISAKIVKQRASQIKSLKRSFKGKEDELKALLRAHYEDILDNTPRNLNSVGKRNPLPKLAATEQQTSVIKELLGEKEGKKLIAFLEDQDRMLEGRAKYARGSSTTTELREAAKGDQVTGAVSGIRNPLNWVAQALDEALMAEPQGVREAAARIMFNPDQAANQQALSELERVLPMIQGNPQLKALFQALGTQGARTAANRREDIPELYITPPKQ